MTGAKQLVQQTGLGTARGNWLNNLAVLWKIALIALVLALGMAVILAVSQQTSGVLRYHTDSLYNFMLIPISSLQEARISAIATVRTLEVLETSSEPLDAQTKQGVYEQAQVYAKQVDVILARYRKDWVTTVSPEFTALLQNNGKTKLQNSEVLQLGELETLNVRMNQVLLAYIAAKGNVSTGVSELTGGYFEISDRLQDLVTLNLEFAALSNQDAIRAGRNGFILEFVTFGLALLWLL